MNSIRFRTAFHVGEDLDALIRFYTQGLGCTLKFRDGSRWAELQAGDGRFALSAPEEAPDGMHCGAVSVFQVEDLDACLGRVMPAGGALIGLRDMGAHGRVATVRDPVGTVFQVLELRKR